MRFRLLKFVVVYFAVIAFSIQSGEAQNLTGIWRGYFITDGYEQYKLEIQIDQSPKKAISGVTYSYLTTVFYGKATMTGLFNASAQTTILQEIKTVELRMSAGSVACIMKYLLQYSKSGKEEFLEGTYTSKYEKADRRNDVKKGEGCGGGKVYLRKVPTSDFYVEPFLRDKPTKKKTEPATDNPVVKTTPVKPPVTTTKPVTKPAAKTPPAKTAVTKPVVKPKTDTAKKTIIPPVAKAEVKKPGAVPLIVPAITRSRQNELAQTIDVSSNEITVRLYDNGEIDDDTISVYLDNQLVLANRRLSASPINLTLHIDESKPEHVLVMVAENLGRIPPNTSLMIVQDGDKRYQVRITSTEQKNAMVRFRFQEQE
jgi:hypothetical protein